jgi:hypothetical protein
VDATNNAEIPFFYPDLEFENKAELFVRGLNYRHYSVPNEHAHDVTHPSHNHEISTTTPSGAGDIDNVNPLDTSQTLDNGQSFTDTFSLPSISGDGAFAYVYFTVQMRGSDDNSSGDVGAGDVRIRNTSTGTNLQPFDGFSTSYSLSDMGRIKPQKPVMLKGIRLRFGLTLAAITALTTAFRTAVLSTVSILITCQIPQHLRWAQLKPAARRPVQRLG